MGGTDSHAGRVARGSGVGWKGKAGSDGYYYRKSCGEDGNALLLGAIDSVANKRSVSISSGVVHEVPADLKKALASDPQVLTAWEDITPLARNEWICWVESAKKAETRSRRIEWGCSSLKDGKRRPCCWPGCDHR